jgi:hypothetical protein
MNDVFKRLFKNPTKLMSLVKNVGSKLDEKLKKGDINESELLKEAGEMMQHMKNMPGMKEMMSKMGMGGGGGKMNMGAMQANLEKSMKSASQKDRLRAKLAANQLAKSMQEQQQQQQQQQAQAQQAQAQQQPSAQSQNNSSMDNVEELVFSTGEQVERSQKKPNKKKKKTKN